VSSPAKDRKIPSAILDPGLHRSILHLIKPKEADLIQSKSALAPSDLLPTVVEAVIEAGSMIRKEFHRNSGPRGVGSKAPIDEEIEKTLRQKLQELHRCSWVGEETGEDNAVSEDVWMVDPHDGTSDFLAGRRGSAVSIALVRSGLPILGVVYARSPRTTVEISLLGLRDRL
jgi:3'-phosphoadenosine 5'-phosphosulfate (PAPS) 3'-phosphatase